MQTFPECYECLVKQSMHALSLAQANDAQKTEAMRQVLHVLATIDPALSPAHVVELTNPIICRVTGVADPYETVRLEGIRQALELLPRLRRRLERAEDAFDVAARLAIAGNIIDIIPGRSYDLWEVIQQALVQPIAGDGVKALLAAVNAAETILYMADNAGESVLDRFLIEQIGKPVVYAVKAGPILNDATIEDALAAGIDQVAQVISTGSQGPGTLLETCSLEFLNRYRQADLVISKGQANFETLDAQGERVFFLMKVKCPLIAREVHARVGDLLIRRGRPAAQTVPGN